MDNWVHDIPAAKPPALRPAPTTPFEQLAAKCRLDRNPDINSILHSAGVRYLSDWRQYRDGQPSRKMAYGRLYYAARAAMFVRHAGIVDQLVLLGDSPAASYSRTGYKARQYASVAVRERLAAGLMCLAKHYKIPTYGRL